MSQSKHLQRRASELGETALVEPGAYAYVSLRLDPLCGEQLDALAELASEVLQCEVGRAAVVRAAVHEWLASNEGGDPGKVVEAIRASLVKRGRRSQKRSCLRIEVVEEPAREEPKPRIRVRRKPSW